MNHVDRKIGRRQTSSWGRTRGSKKRAANKAARRAGKVRV